VRALGERQREKERKAGAPRLLALVALDLYR